MSAMAETLAPTTESKPPQTDQHRHPWHPVAIAHTRTLRTKTAPPPTRKPPQTPPQIPPNTPGKPSGSIEYWESLSPCQSSFVHCCKSCGSPRGLKSPQLPPQLRVRRVLCPQECCAGLLTG
jgi:hypothetical protein